MRPKRVFAIVPELSQGDAVSTDALHLNQALTSLGYTTAIMYNRNDLTDPTSHLKQVFGRIEAEPAAFKEDILLYHYAVEWPLGDQIYQKFPGKRILRYHNVTPPELLQPYNKQIADFCSRGRDNVKKLDVPDLLLAVSTENLNDYQALTGNKSNSAVLPPYSQAEFLLSAETDHRLAAKLKSITEPKFLFVGRISPHKQVHQLIKRIDAQLQKQNRPKRKRSFFESVPFQWLPLGRGSFANAPTLFVVGSFSKEFSSYTKLVRQVARKSHYLQTVFLSKVSESTLATLYREANLLITLSAHEGFCVPVAEALAFDLPMILPNTDLFRTTSLGQAEFFDSADDLLLTPIKRNTHKLFQENYSYQSLNRRLKEILEN